MVTFKIVEEIRCNFMRLKLIPYFIACLKLIIPLSLVGQSGKIDSTIVIPPAWAFGVLYGGYTDQSETIGRIKEIINHDYPIDGYWIDSWFWNYQNKGRGPSGYLDFIGDTIAYPKMEVMWDFMKENKIKSGIWIWDCVIEEGNEQVFKEAYLDVKSKENPVGYFKSISINKSTWHNGGKLDQPGQLKKGRALGDFDFENPNAVKYFHNKLAPFFNKGVDFLKLDRSARLPYCKAAFEATQALGLETKGRGFLLVHSESKAEVYNKYPAKWTDDTQIAWSHPTENWPRGGLKENVEYITIPGQKGFDVPFIGCDIGGYSYGLEPIPEKEDEELFIRWAQFGAFLPIMEVFSAYETPSNSLAWKFSERADEIFRATSQLRLKLFPYIYSYAHQSRWEGENIIRSDGKCAYQYHFGEELLVGPVVEKGAVTKEIYLPPGKWIDFHTHKVYKGNQNVTVDAPLHQIPILIRSGAIIPMRNYARSVELGNNEHLSLMVFPEGNSAFKLYEDDGISNEYLAGGYAITNYHCKMTDSAVQFTISPIQGDYDGILKRRMTDIHLYLKSRPTTVSWNGKEMKNLDENVFNELTVGSWSYDEEGGKIILRLEDSTSTKTEIKIIL
ncbi:MAG: alpha-glucosidase [Phycisphaeraceae bacterium]|nr:alpha-glucosidase [Phycisphaeraceae bacterium]